MSTEKKRNTQKPLKTKDEMLANYKKHYQFYKQKCDGLQSEIAQLREQQQDTIEASKRAVKRARQDADNARARAKRLKQKLDQVSHING